MASEWSRLPEATAVIPVRNCEHGALWPTAQVCTGVNRSVVVPSPSWPLLLLPQPTTVPSPRSARTWRRPAAIAVTPVRNCEHGAVAPTAHTRTGVVTGSFVVPLPTEPTAPLPQATTVPSTSSAALVLSSPAATCTTWVSWPGHGALWPTAHTFTGARRSVVVPSPSCP